MKFRETIAFGLLFRLLYVLRACKKTNALDRALLSLPGLIRRSNRLFLKVRQLHQRRKWCIGPERAQTAFYCQKKPPKIKCLFLLLKRSGDRPLCNQSHLI